MVKMVTLDGITKTYEHGKIPAVTDVSFSVGKGELFGLIGPDGAGKSTIFRILTTLLLPDQGMATVAGRPPLARKLGVCATEVFTSSVT